MKYLKKILFPVFSIFLAYRSIDLLKNLMKSSPDNFSQTEAVIISFLLTLFITGVFAFVGFAYPTSSLVSDRYYKIKNKKNLLFISNVLGLKYFQLFLLFVFWGRKNNRKKYFNGTKSGLLNFVYQTKQSEFGHLAACLAIIISSFILLFYEYFFIVFITTLINMIGNVYPIILQRSHRLRLEKLTNGTTIK